MHGPEPLPPLSMGDLPAALAEGTRRARACGALQGIETRQTWIDDAGVRFLVRAVSSLARKGAARPAAAEGPPANPFLPPEPALTLGTVNATHLAVLNKFNVLDHHLLLVTRGFEHQEMLLGQADFAALALALGAIDGLGFYNGGRAAGASQPHKHLQLVPLPLADGSPGLPMEALLAPNGGAATAMELPALPFRHAFQRLPGGWWTRQDGAAALWERYRRMCAHCGVGAPQRRDGAARQSAPYNLLVRRGWMLLVPRCREHWQGISVNALGYAGSLFVRGEAQLSRVRTAGPMALLTAVGLAR